MASPRKKNENSRNHSRHCQMVNTQNGNNSDHNPNGGKKTKGRGRQNRYWSLWRHLRWPASRRKSMSKRSFREKKDNRDENSKRLRELRSDLSKDLPSLHMKDLFEKSSFFQEFRIIFKGFDETRKLCLKCVAVFPENAVVKKRVLVHWWVGEGLLDRIVTEESSEEIASNILKEFVDKQFIYSVKKKGRKVMNSFKMHPLVRSAVITLAQDDGFCSYISKIDSNTNFQGCRRACLVAAPEESFPQKPGNSPNSNQENLETLFNINYQFPDFKTEQFKTIRNIKVLYLGMWQSSQKKAHIEVEGTEFFKGFKYMKNLSLLSLQGIFGIRKIPSSIKKLKNLRILDLKACYNLEKLPKEVGSLKKLSHLDISGCYLLDHMPKELSSLPQLQVLKGFVIGDPRCRNSFKLAELTKLKKLRKLSINVNSENFSMNELSNTLFECKKLLKLKIAWGGGSSKPKNSKLRTPGKAASRLRGSVIKVINARRPLTSRRNIINSDQESKSNIEKLDLQCFPDETLPIWLTPKNLKNLKKFYIRGGRLKSLRGMGAETWANIEHLRLKYLFQLNINWRELKELFPKLQYLENFRCPNVTFCPCDGRGVWVSSEQNKKIHCST